MTCLLTKQSVGGGAEVGASGNVESQHLRVALAGDPHHSTRALTVGHRYTPAIAKFPHASITDHFHTINRHPIESSSTVLEVYLNIGTAPTRCSRGNCVYTDGNHSVYSTISEHGCKESID